MWWQQVSHHDSDVSQAVTKHEVKSILEHRFVRWSKMQERKESPRAAMDPVGVALAPHVAKISHRDSTGLGSHQVCHITVCLQMLATSHSWLAVTHGPQKPSPLC